MLRLPAFGVLVIVLAAVAAAFAAAERLPPTPRRLPQVRTAPVATVPPIRIAPQAPLDRLEAAVRARRWEEAGAIERELPETTERSKRLADQHRRGAQRDVGGVIESTVLRGVLAALGPADEKPARLAQLATDRTYTIPPARLNDLLVFIPGALASEDAVVAMFEEMRVLRIEGLELNVVGRDVSPLPGMSGVALRYIGGTAIGRVPAMLFASSTLIEGVDLQARQSGLGEVLTALSGRRSLRRLRLPAKPGLDEIGLRALGTLSGLQDLEFCGDGLGDAAWERFGPYPELHRLRLSGAAPSPAFPRLLVAGSPRLEDLTCDGSRLTVQAVTQLGQLPWLYTLRLENRLPGPAFTALAGMRALHRLTCSIDESDKVADLSPLAALPDLEELTLGIKMPGSGLRDPAGLERVGATRLRLQFGGVSDSFAAAVRRMPRLDRLELAGTSLSDAGVLQMACNPTLRELEIGDNDGIVGICLPSLLHWPGLRELRVASDSIPESVLLACPDPGVIERFTWTVGGSPSAALLAHLTAWPGMVQVTVNGTRIDKDARQRLQQANERRAAVPADIPGRAGGF